ncbi:MAG TPA: adenylate/guanylate cyclase domain-containing protein [Ktedonobacterales bacterium]
MPDERKLVSVLFCDVTGSTALGESLELEDLRALMAGYYAHAQRIVEAHGGGLAKFIGDAVMAVFGLPQAHSNDAERALASALALRQAVDSDAVLGGRLVLRMGVNTGEVMTSMTGDAHHGDFLVTGDAVNVAARLEEGADPGEILVSARAAAATEATFVFGQGRSLTITGKSQPLGVYPLTAQRPARQLGRPPLVGRRHDLAQLALLRDRAMVDRRPQLVSIIAPAGAGKTRLIEEVLARLDPSDGFHVAITRCPPYGQTLAYWPLRGLLDELLGAPHNRERVAAALVAAGHTPEDAERLAALALATVGVESKSESDAGAEREVIFSAWRLLVEALAKQAPRIIVFEDLHWASESLLDLVESVMQPRNEAPLLIVATSRPELLDRRPAWGGGRRNFTALTLDPLTASETRTLVARLAKGASETARRKIEERSGGNPFFAIELARSMRDGGAAPDSLPDTVQEALQERLDALSPRERAVLQSAAVAGRTFRLATLRAALNDGGGADVEMALENLLARDLISPAEGGSYIFRHLLIRDVAYGALSRSERIRMHLAVAAWLEEFAADRIDEFVALIAFHYSQAAQLARQSAVPVAPLVDTAQAVYYLERAAALAEHAGALIEAQVHLQRAIELAPARDSVRLYEALGDCALVTKDAVQAYRAAETSWRNDPQADPLVGARLARKQFGAIVRQWANTPEEVRREEVVALRERAWRQVDACGDEDERWQMRVIDLLWPDWSGEPASAGARGQMAQALEAAAYFESRDDWPSFHKALDRYAVCAATIGAFEESGAASRRRLAAPVVTFLDRAEATGHLLWLRLAVGDYAGALDNARSALTQRRTGEPVWPLSGAISTASIAALVSGAWSHIDALVAAQEEAWDELQREEGLGQLLGSFYAALSVALAREDHAAAGRASAALMRVRPRGIDWGDERAALAVGFDALARDDPAPVLAQLESLTTQAPNLHDMDTRPFRIMFVNEHGLALSSSYFAWFDTQPRSRWIDLHLRCMGIARALAAGDNAALAEAIDDAEAHGLAPHAARMRVVLAQRTGVRGRLERARPALKRLGDRLFLRRLAEVEAALG